VLSVILMYLYDISWFAAFLSALQEIPSDNTCSGWHFLFVLWWYVWLYTENPYSCCVFPLQVLMKDIVTSVPQEEVKTVIRKCLEQAALVNYQRLSEYAKLEGKSLLLCVRYTVVETHLLTCWVSESYRERFLSHKTQMWESKCSVGMVSEFSGAELAIYCYHTCLL